METANKRLWNCASGSGLQRQSMLPRTRFRCIAERLVDRAALVPIGKLIGVVRAARLTGLAAGDEHDGVVPISEISDKTHGWTVVFGGRTRAVGGSGLRHASDAQKSLERTGAAQRMDHIQCVEPFPGPIVDLRFVTHLSEDCHGAISGRYEQFVVGFVSYRQPLGGTLGQ